MRGMRVVEGLCRGEDGLRGRLVVCFERWSALCRVWFALGLTSHQKQEVQSAFYDVEPASCPSSESFHSMNPPVATL